MSLWIRLTRLLGIRDDERRPFSWLAAHSLFNGICVAFLFSAAYALFLDRYEVEESAGKRDIGETLDRLLEIGLICLG